MTNSGTEPLNGNAAGRQFPNWLVAVFLLLLAFAVEYAPPFFGNQNQYYAHAVNSAALKSDWLVGTADPYPVFTRLAIWLIDISHPAGVAIAAYAATVLALLAVYLFARGMSAGKDPRIALLATLLVSATLATPTGYSLFNGFGGQYIISKSAYFQPSSAGALIMLSLYLWLFKVGDARFFQPRFLAAAALAIIGCIIHPTYLIALATALGILAVVQFVLQGRNRFLDYIGVGLIIVAILSVVNPGVFGIGNPGPQFEAALDRFAYERIPGHTLWWRWTRINVVFPMVLAGGIYAAVRWLRQDSLALWLLGCSAVSLGAVLILPFLTSGRLLLMFPWRISVCLVPIAGTALAVALAQWMIARWNLRHWALYLAAAMLGALGLHRTVDGWRATDLDPAVALLREQRPAGIGIVPPDQELLRLNVPIAVYVDWKSPPYASDDLVEWWQRNDQVKALEQDPSRLCGNNWEQPVAWRLVAADAPLPPCSGQWMIKARKGPWVLLVRQAPAR